MSNANLKLYIFAAILLFISVDANVKLCIYEYIEEYVAVKHLQQDAMKYERRYDALKPLIPPHELVAYITDEELDPGVMHLAQYSMSPFFITTELSKCRYAVTNFTNIAFTKERLRYAESFGFKVLKKIDNTAMLLKKD